VTLDAKKRRFYENIYNLKRETLLSHFFFQSFASFIREEKKRQNVQLLDFRIQYRFF
jgi:hypothetical protein